MTVGRKIKEANKAIWTALKDGVVVFHGEDQWKKVQKAFYCLWNYAKCVVVIDGIHVRVEAPANDGSSFYNCKGCLIVIPVDVCDARYRFIGKVIWANCYDRDAGVF